MLAGAQTSQLSLPGAGLRGNPETPTPRHRRHRAAPSLSPPAELGDSLSRRGTSICRLLSTSTRLRCRKTLPDERFCTESRLGEDICFFPAIMFFFFSLFLFFFFLGNSSWKQAGGYSQLLRHCLVWVAACSKIPAVLSPGSLLSGMRDKVPTASSCPGGQPSDPKPLSPAPLNALHTTTPSQQPTHTSQPRQSGQENSVNLLDTLTTAPYENQKWHAILPTALTPLCTGMELKNRYSGFLMLQSSCLTEPTAGALCRSIATVFM